MTETELFDEETFGAIRSSATRICGEIHESATRNLRKAQDKQKKGFDRRHLLNNEIKVGILSYCVITKEKTEREEGFHLDGLHCVKSV